MAKKKNIDLDQKEDECIQEKKSMLAEAALQIKYELQKIEPGHREIDIAVKDAIKSINHVSSLIKHIEHCEAVRSK